MYGKKLSELIEVSCEQSSSFHMVVIQQGENPKNLHSDKYKSVLLCPLIALLLGFCSIHLLVNSTQLPVPADENHAQSMMLPLTCFILVTVWSTWCLGLFSIQLLIWGLLWPEYFIIFLCSTRLGGIFNELQTVHLQQCVKTWRFNENLNDA